MVSTATIRSTNAKATKDKRNREKLLAGPGGSEFSINGPDNDLEIDYYDYNVVNAGAAPGSYLGMIYYCFFFNTLLFIRIICFGWEYADVKT